MGYILQRYLPQGAATSSLQESRLQWVPPTDLRLAGAGSGGPGVLWLTSHPQKELLKLAYEREVSSSLEGEILSLAVEAGFFL